MGYNFGTQVPKRDFNSTIVRLKERVVPLLPVLFGLFQFYDSTIKSDDGQTCQFISENFNSTIVRLKVDKCLLYMPFFHDFNSTIVRLKDHYRLCYCLVDTHFNSTIVRLKVFQETIR